MKKIIIFLMLSFAVFGLISVQTFALTDLNETKYSEWSISQEPNGQYILNSKMVLIDFSSITIELWTDIDLYNAEKVMDYALLSNTINDVVMQSSVKIYTSPLSASSDRIYYFMNSSLWGSDLFYLESSEGASLDVSEHYNKYLKVSVVLNPSLTSLQRSTVLNVFNNKPTEIFNVLYEYNLSAYNYQFKSQPTTINDTWWHVLDNNKAYVYMRPILFNRDTEEQTLNPGYNHWPINHFNPTFLDVDSWYYSKYWPNENGITKPAEGWNRMTIEVKYENGLSEVVYNGIVEHGIRFSSGTPYKDANGLNSYYVWGINTTKFVDGKTLYDETVFSTVQNREYRSDHIESIRIYFQQNHVSETVTLSEVPLTNGSIYDDESGFEVAQAFININNNSALIQIYYNGNSYNLEFIGIDTSFLEGVKKAYYYSYQGNKYLRLEYLEHVNLSTYVGNTYDTANLKWVPHTDWNLTTNEVIHTNKVWAVTYFSKEDANNVYAYFYMPEVVSDNLIHVDMQFDYRYYEPGIPDFWNKYPLSTRTQVLSLDYDEVNTTTPGWKQDIYKYVPVGMAIGAMIPGVRWPVLLIGSAMLAANWASESVNFLQKNINEISRINPDLALKQKLETIYSEMTSQSVSIDTNNNGLYKLHVGQYDLYDKVEVIENTEKLSGIVYEVKGRLIYVEDDFILDNFDRDNNLGPAPEPDLIPPILSNFGEYMIYVWVILGVIVVINILPNIDKFLGSVNRIVSSPRKLVAFGIVIIVILLIIGFI